MNAVILFFVTCFCASAALQNPKTACKSHPRCKAVLQDPLLHLGSAWNDISSWTVQAAKDVRVEVGKVDLTVVEEWVSQTGKDVKQEVDKVDLGEAGKWLGQAGADVGHWTQQAAKAVKTKLDKIEFTAVNQWIQQSASGLQSSLDSMDTTDFGIWLKQASKDVGLDGALSGLQHARLEELPDNVVQYIKDNPGQTAFYVVNGVVFFYPGIVYGPILHALGFRNGVGAGTFAAKIQSTFGAAVPARGWFAHLTSAGAKAGGYGAGVLNGVTRAGSLVAGAANQFVQRQNDTASRNEL